MREGNPRGAGEPKDRQELPASGVAEIGAGLEGEGRRVAVVVSRFNQQVTERLAAGAIEALMEHGVAATDLQVIWVPGAWELPYACAWLVDRGGLDALVALGCVIRGETPHFEFVAGEAVRGLGALAARSSTPIGFGVLTTDDLGQAMDRAVPGEGNKGREAALSALEMTNLFERIR